MARTVTIHQPNYLPWIGLFSKLKHSDCLIIGDTYLLGGQSVFNRNKIRTSTGWQYLTIPLGHKSEGMKIHDVPAPAEKNWQKAHRKLIHDNYLKSDFYVHHQDFFQDVYSQDFQYVWQMNEKIIQYLMKCFNVEIDVVRASDLKVDPRLEKTDLMIGLLKAAGADVYLSGPSGRQYLESEKFPQNNIQLKYFEFRHPVYKQRYPGFEPNMSAIDLLFNTGTAAAELINNAGRITD
jgi:hypothetical protein